ncbi:integrase [Gossypium australe]|uniref:Integrase n=1 Tax=Gossypium australe TaxID=47621 RepID=A0A5B6VYS7_9ROSI|nr:integrase [Gossypium australe]
MEALVIVQPESGKEFIVYSDAALNGLGCVMMQEGKVIVYASRRWLELLKDYKLVIDYHPGKANVVANALSRKSLYALRAMNSQIDLCDDGSVLAELKVRLMFVHQIRDAQKIDDDMISKQAQCDLNLDSEFRVDSDDCLRVRDRICVPKKSELIHLILNEAHNSHLTVHPESTKMYNNLKQFYWWHGKLSPRFIGPYEIIERIGPIAYRLLLPSGLEKIHNVFHVSMLRRHRSDPSHVIAPTKVEIQLDLSYSEEPIQFLAREIKELINKKISLVKVLWHKHGVGEAT